MSANKLDFAERTADPTEAALAGSKTEGTVGEGSDEGSNEVNEYGIRTAHPAQFANISKTERFLDDEDDGQNKSKRSGGSTERSVFYERKGDRGIRTERPDNFSRTECDLGSVDERIGFQGVSLNMPTMEIEKPKMTALPKKVDGKEGKSRRKDRQNTIKYVLSERSCEVEESGDRGIRTERPDNYSRTECDLGSKKESGENRIMPSMEFEIEMVTLPKKTAEEKGKSRSKDRRKTSTKYPTLSERSCEVEVTGDRGIRTERPDNYSRTECDLSKKESGENKIMPSMEFEIEKDTLPKKKAEEKRKSRSKYRRKTSTKYPTLSDRSCEVEVTGDRGIRTERPDNYSRTSCDLSQDKNGENKVMPTMDIETPKVKILPKKTEDDTKRRSRSKSRRNTSIEQLLSDRSCEVEESGDRGIRTERPDNNSMTSCDLRSKDEKGENKNMPTMEFGTKEDTLPKKKAHETTNGKSRSKERRRTSIRNPPLSDRSCEVETTGDRGIRTERPDNVSRTERFLGSDNNQRFQGQSAEEVTPKTMEIKSKGSTLPKKPDTDTKQKIVSFLSRSRSPDRTHPSIQQTSSPIQSVSREISSAVQNESEVWFPTLKRAYETIWTNNNAFVKALVLIWLIMSTLMIEKVLVTFINVYWVIKVDDCHSAHALCNHFGIACFSRCGAARWDILWYKIFGE